jgi:anthranilate phosphoribosyltransferase
MKEILSYLFDQNALTKEVARETLTKMGQGAYSESEMASFLTVYMMRKITSPELAGFREAFLDLCIPVDLSGQPTIDVCGTGGDEKNTFNISTLASFVLAGAGIKVAKHGNYAVSSASGSSNVLERLGYKFSNNQDKLRREIDETNITYMHAPLFHPAMKHIGPVRKSLKMKTFFNILGPMVNPSRPNNQVVGVFDEEVLRLYNEVFNAAGIRSFILYSLDGYDEISLTGGFRAVSDQEDKLFSPEDLGLKLVKPEDIHGGNNAEEATQIFSTIIGGSGSQAQTDVVAANAAFAIKVMHPDYSFSDCIETAKESIRSGKAKKALRKLIELQ